MSTDITKNRKRTKLFKDKKNLILLANISQQGIVLKSKNLREKLFRLLGRSQERLICLSTSEQKACETAVVYKLEFDAKRRGRKKGPPPSSLKFKKIIYYVNGGTQERKFDF